MLTVARAVAEIRPRFHPQGGRFVVKSYPKNKHYRRVSLDAALVARLDQYVTDRGLKAGDLLFGFPVHYLAYRHGTTTGYSMGGADARIAGRPMPITGQCEGKRAGIGHRWAGR